MARKKRIYTDHDDDLLFFQRRSIINRLRQGSRYWPAKKICLDKAREDVEIGIYKNGSPKFKIKYKCNKCSGLFNIQDINVNHKIPVIDPIEGFQDWNTYINRLYCKSDNLEVLCIPCHDALTLKQNKKRTKSKK